MLTEQSYELAVQGLYRPATPGPRLASLFVLKAANIVLLKDYIILRY